PSPPCASGTSSAVQPSSTSLVHSSGSQPATVSMARRTATGELCCFKSCRACRRSASCSSVRSKRMLVPRESREAIALPGGVAEHLGGEHEGAAIEDAVEDLAAAVDGADHRVLADGDVEAHAGGVAAVDQVQPFEGDAGRVRVDEEERDPAAGGGADDVAIGH